MAEKKKVCDHNAPDCCCPFAYTDASELVQNYGCIPTPHDIVTMRQEYGKTWACHSEPSKPCVGALRYMAERGLPCVVIDPVLVTEADDWDRWTVKNTPSNRLEFKTVTSI